MYVSNYLKNITIKKNVLLTELAEEVGISRTYLSYIRNGKKNLSYESWQKIIEFLNLDKEEELEAWEAWNYDRMSPEMIKRVEELKEENKQLRNLVDAIKFLNK